MSKTELIIFPTKLSPPPKCPFPGQWQHCQLRYHVRKQEASHIPLSFPWSSSVRLKLPILSCSHVLLPVWLGLSRYLETSSQQTISLSLMLPSNPPFITTRVSVLEHFCSCPSLVKSLPPHCPQKNVHMVNKACKPVLIWSYLPTLPTEQPTL